MSKYVIWAIIVISCYAMAEVRGYYFPSFWLGNSWKRSTGATLNHK